MAFDAKVEAQRVVNWIKDYMEENGPDAPIIIGISGGKDSAACAAASVAAVGSSRVLGILMPSGIQSDIRDAEDCCRFLKIRRMTFNIGPIVRDMYNTLKATRYKDFSKINTVVGYNHPARIRMTVLYMIANQLGGRVINTCNMSETYIGYDTKFGDQCGDFSPFQHYTATEVAEIGIALGMPEKAMRKPPNDGMCGQNDEDRFGFTYKMLDSYLRGGEVAPAVAERVEQMHQRALHKLCIDIPTCPYFPQGSKILTVPMTNTCVNELPKTPPATAAALEDAVKYDPSVIATGVKPLDIPSDAVVYQGIMPTPTGETAVGTGDFVYDEEHKRYVKKG